MTTMRGDCIACHRTRNSCDRAIITASRRNDQTIRWQMS
jgi:hypothetical protein